MVALVPGGRSDRFPFQHDATGAATQPGTDPPSGTERGQTVEDVRRSRLAGGPPCQDRTLCGSAAETQFWLPVTRTSHGSAPRLTVWREAEFPTGDRCTMSSPQPARRPHEGRRRGPTPAATDRDWASCWPRSDRDKARASESRRRLEAPAPQTLVGAGPTKGHNDCCDKKCKGPSRVRVRTAQTLRSSESLA